MDLSWLFTCVETRGNLLWGFPEISNARKRGGIIGLIVSSCGNSWKPLVRFPPSFQCRESRWNRQVDCFQVWKPSGNHIGVSQKWKLRGNYWCHDSLWFPAGFHFWETAFFTQCLTYRIHSVGIQAHISIHHGLYQSENFRRRRVSLENC